jgi:hypothetical protein
MVLSMYTYRVDDFRDKINFFLNFWIVSDFANAPMMMCSIEIYIFFSKLANFINNLSVLACGHMAFILILFAQIYTFQNTLLQS